MTRVKLTRNQLNKIINDDINSRFSIRSTLQQVQENISMRESEIAQENMFSSDIKALEHILSTLRNMIHEVGTADVNKEIFFNIAAVDEDLINKIVEFNMRLLSLAKELLNIVQNQFDITIIKEKVNFILNTFHERQNLFEAGKINLRNF